MDRYAEDLSRPGALTDALNRYRASLAPRLRLTPPSPLPAMTVPAMGIWSTGDIYVVEDHVRLPEKFVSGRWRYERIESASDWIPLDGPARLSTPVVDFLSADDAS